MIARIFATIFTATLFCTFGCSNAPVTHPPSPSKHTFSEIALLEQACIANVQAALIRLDTKRMDTFFGSALNGLVDCEASSGLAHVPTKEVSRWLVNATGLRVATRIPATPAALAKTPASNDARITYQRACIAYMRRYIPASVANAGDDSDVAAAVVFNGLEQCDSDAGFATIAPSELAQIMQAKKLL